MEIPRFPSLAAILAIGLALPVAAETVAPSPDASVAATDTAIAAAGSGAPAPKTVAPGQTGGDFTFRRVGVATAPIGKRITVQIDPKAEMYRITPGGKVRRPGDPSLAELLRPPPVEGPKVATDFDWYWDLVSPAIGGDAAGRFRAALAAVDGAPEKVGTPRLQALQKIVDAHGTDILASTVGTRVSPALVLAVIAVESAGRTDARSHVGAQGLMQLMPDTARRFGVSNSLDPKANIRGGTAYLNWLLNEFGQDPVLALAGYNAGEGAVAKYQGVPPFAETRGYVPKVLAAWQLARSLCLTPPDLVGDGCVFVGPQMAGN